MLREDARILTTCPDCAETIEIGIEDGKLSGGPGLVHFALPPIRWWDDIGFT